MSLINDALKKAQRQRTNNPFGIDAPMPGGGGGRVARRSSGMPTQTILLIVAGCAILVVLSALGAVFFTRGNSAAAKSPTSLAIATPSTPAMAAPTENILPALEIPPLALPARTEVAPAPGPTSPAGGTVAPVAEIKVEPVAPPPAAAKTAPLIDSAPAPAAGPAPRPVVTEERIHAYLDALRVTGVRTSGASSRVLLNEKVYRVNDIVDRNLALKLTGVETDFLTFTDATGTEYRKTF